MVSYCYGRGRPSVSDDLVLVLKYASKVKRYGTTRNLMFSTWRRRYYASNGCSLCPHISGENTHLSMKQVLSWCFLLESLIFATVAINISSTLLWYIPGLTMYEMDHRRWTVDTHQWLNIHFDNKMMDICILHIWSYAIGVTQNASVSYRQNNNLRERLLPDANPSTLPGNLFNKELGTRELVKFTVNSEYACSRVYLFIY